MSLQHWSLVTGTKRRRGEGEQASDSVQGPFHLIQQFFLVLLRQCFPIRRRVRAQLGGERRRNEKGALSAGVTSATLKKHDGAELPVSHGESLSFSP